MDYYSILDQSSSQAAPETAWPNRAPAESSSPLPATSREPLGFPGDDGGKSLIEMAERDLNATLQLLAERAQYITGASGAAIALREGGEMICRASAGPSAPELGAHLQVNSGLSGESVRTRQTLRCDDAETDPRVNREMKDEQRWRKDVNTLLSGVGLGTRDEVVRSGGSTTRSRALGLASRASTSLNVGS